MQLTEEKTFFHAHHASAASEACRIDLDAQLHYSRTMSVL
jgi:hypothetical protein